VLFSPNQSNQSLMNQWRQRLGKFLGMDWRKGEGILGDGSHPVGSRSEDPI